MADPTKPLYDSIILRNVDDADGRVRTADLPAYGS